MAEQIEKLLMGDLVFMKLTFNSNAMKTLRAYKKNVSEHSRSINNISSGKKINSSKDNPNSISKLGNLEREIRGHQSSRKNIQDTVSMIQSADSVMGSLNERISRIRELAISVGSPTAGDDEKNIIQNEVNTLLSGMEFDVENFSFNGLNILGNKDVADNSNPKNVDLQSSGNSGEITKIPSYNFSLDTLGIENLDVVNSEISSTLEKLDNASSQILEARAKLGTISNNLEDKIHHSESLEIVLSGSKSKIDDADVALEMLTFSKTLILTESNIKNMSKTIYFPVDIVNAIGKLYK